MLQQPSQIEGLPDALLQGGVEARGWARDIQRCASKNPYGTRGCRAHVHASGCCSNPQKAARCIAAVRCRGSWGPQGYPWLCQQKPSRNKGLPRMCSTMHSNNRHDRRAARRVAIVKGPAEGPQKWSGSCKALAKMLDFEATNGASGPPAPSQVLQEGPRGCQQKPPGLGFILYNTSVGGPSGRQGGGSRPALPGSMTFFSAREARAASVSAWRLPSPQLGL